MKSTTWLVLAGLLAVSCGDARLDTRTFELKFLRGEEARDIIRPYVFDDRPKAAGQISTQGPWITVRETPDNLEKIARVLAQYDRARPSVRLTFQIIHADGAPTNDPAIAEVETSLRKLFRFRGYRLVAEAVAGGMEGTELRQIVTGVGGPYVITATIYDARGSGDSGSVRINAVLFVQRLGDVLNTTVTLRPGQTAVLGNAQMSERTGGGTLILAVRPELVQN